MSSETKNRSIGRLGGAKRFEALVLSTKKISNAYSVSNRDGTEASAQTIRTTSEVLVAAVTRIWHIGFHIGDVRELTKLHIYALAQNWIDTGYKRTTISNSLCRLRRLGDWLGKPDLVDESLSAEIKAEFRARSQATGLPSQRSVRFPGMTRKYFEDAKPSDD